MTLLISSSVKNVEDIRAAAGLAVVDQVFPCGEALHIGGNVAYGLTRVRMFSGQPKASGDSVNHSVCVCTPARSAQYINSRSVLGNSSEPRLAFDRFTNLSERSNVCLVDGPFARHSSVHSSERFLRDANQLSQGLIDGSVVREILCHVRREEHEVGTAL